MNFWIVEQKFASKAFEIHSLHKYKPSAVSIGQDIFDSFDYDTEGDGVRLRRGTIGEGGLTIGDRVFWMRMCPAKTPAQIRDEQYEREISQPEEEDDDVHDEEACDAADLVLYCGR